MERAAKKQLNQSLVSQNSYLESPRRKMNVFNLIDEETKDQHGCFYNTTHMMCKDELLTQDEVLVKLKKLYGKDEHNAA